MDKKLIWAIVIIIVAILVVGGYYYFILAPQKIAPVPMPALNENTNLAPVGILPQNTNAPVVIPPTNVTPPPVAAPVPPVPKNQVKTYQVQIANFAFSPATLNIKVGDTVKWTNDDQPVHAIASANFASSNLNTGDSYSFTLTQPGSYDYHCAIHPFMAGKIIVSQ